MHFPRFQISILLLLLLVFEVSAQSIKSTGLVNTENGSALPASVLLKGTSIGTVTEFDGSFKLDVSRAGNFTITISCVGYISQSKDFTAKADQEMKLNFTLKSDFKNMAEAVILGKTEAQQIKETGFNVNAIDVKRLAG